MTKLPIERRLQILGEHVVRARIHYDLWWFLENKDSRHQILDTLNGFPEFFLIDTNAHFASMIIRSGVVWDKANVSLPVVARELLDPKRHAAHKNLDANIEALRKKAEGILFLRHNVIAHVTDKESRVEAFKKAGIITNELPGMMQSWLDAINALHSIQNPDVDPTFPVEFRDLPLQHLQRLIVQLGGPDLRPRTTLDDILGA